MNLEGGSCPGPSCSSCARPRRAAPRAGALGPTPSARNGILGRDVGLWNRGGSSAMVLNLPPAPARAARARRAAPILGKCCNNGIERTGLGRGFIQGTAFSSARRRGDAADWRVPSPAPLSAQPGPTGDLVEEVLLVAWRRLDDIPAGAEIPWLIGARNVLRNALRQQRRISRCRPGCARLRPTPRRGLRDADEGCARRSTP